MSLESWEANGWLTKHTTSREEIQNVFGIIERDLAECKLVSSSDWRFSIAYNSALKCCLIPLYCRGYRTSRSGGDHYRAIQSLSLTLGQSFNDLRDYLDECRQRRNISDYEQAGTISDTEADSLVEEVDTLYDQVKSWLSEHYPQYL